jgi:hypothetical protein
MKKLTVVLFTLFSTLTVQGATVPATPNSDLFSATYVQLGYSFMQVGYKSTDDISKLSTSGYPNTVNAPQIAVGFPISPKINLEFGYSFTSAFTGGSSIYPTNFALMEARIFISIGYKLRKS